MFWPTSSTSSFHWVKNWVLRANILGRKQKTDPSILPGYNGWTVDISQWLLMFIILIIHNKTWLLNNDTVTRFIESTIVNTLRPVSDGIFQQPYWVDSMSVLLISGCLFADEEAVADWSKSLPQGQSCIWARTLSRFLAHCNEQWVQLRALKRRLFLE